jgi:hypothetical protein
MLMEFKSGVTLDRHFESLPEEQKGSIVGKIADVFSVIQGVVLPSTVTSYGGLTVSEEGEIVSGQMTTLQGGPWSTYDAFLRAKLEAQLEGADKSPALDGWRENGIRERVGEFLSSRLGTKLLESGVDGTQRVLVHGDLSEFETPWLIDPLKC